MKILMRGNSTNENYDADIGYVFVDLTPGLAKRVLKRVAAFKRLKKEDRQALETYYWTGEALYLRYDKVGEKDAERINTEGDFIETELKLTEDDGERIECPQMIVDEDAVSFTAIPKHAGIYIMSERIPLKTIREAAKKK